MGTVSSYDRNQRRGFEFRVRLKSSFDLLAGAHRP
jgi:hypothetical protein